MTLLAVFKGLAVLLSTIIAAALASASSPSGDLQALADAFVARLSPHYQNADPIPGAGIPEGELLVFEARIGPYTLEAPIPAIKRGDGIMIPVDAFADALFLAIETNPEATIAQGFAYDEDTPARLDLTTRTARLGDRERNLSPGEIESDGVDLYLSERAMGAWLEMTIAVDFRFLILSLELNRDLPIIASFERRRSSGSTPEAIGPPQHPRADAPIALAAAPSIDASASYRVRENPGRGRSEQLSYSALISGEVARMSARGFVAGRAQSPIETARATLFRADPQGGLLGPLGARRVEVGDIETPSAAFAPASGLQRGARATNRPLFAPATAGRTDITGDAPPGWDVELYRGGTRLGALQAGEDGRYVFEDVDLSPGLNRFRLVFYGPQGEVREERRDLPGDPALSGPGFIYDVSIAEAGRGLFGGAAAGSDGDRGLRLSALGQWRIGERSSLAAGLDTPILDGDRRVQAIAGGATRIGSAFLRAEGRADAAGGGAVRASLSAPVAGQQARFEQTLWRDFPRAGAEPLSAQESALLLSGALPAPGAATGAYQLQTSVRRDAAGASAQGRLQATGRLGPASLSTNLRWREGASDPLTAETGLTINAARTLIRGGIGADLIEGAVTKAELTARRRITSDFSLAVGADYDLETEITDLEARADWTLGPFTVGPRVQWASDGRWSAQLDGRVSLLWDAFSPVPQLSADRTAGLGAAAVRVFEDVDGDGAFTAADLPLEAVRLRARQARRRAQTGADGIARLTRMPPYALTDLELDASSLPDPYLAPAREGFAFAPRPGRMQSFEIPLVATSEVEGGVVLNQGGARVPIGGLTVAAVDLAGRVVDETRTAADGFYILAGLPPGLYRLRVSGADAGRWRQDGLSFFPVREVREVLIRDIVLEPTGAALARALVPPAPAGGYGARLSGYDSAAARNAALLLLIAAGEPVRAGVDEAGGPTIQAGPFETQEAALAACRRLAPGGADCRVLRPA